MQAIDLIPQDQFIDEWCGFTVYDAETGERLDWETDFYCLDNDGDLINLIMIENGCYSDAVVPKEGKYIIQFATGEYMRW